ncbi:MAG: AMP-binding protein, partial [Kibdelosporangium sp.]
MREIAVAPLVEPYGGGLADLIYNNAAQDPDTVVFSRKVGAGWQDITAAQFLTQVIDVGKGLIGSGVGAGDRVGILAATRYEWTLFDFAIWAVGGVPVPIYATSSTEQVQWILSDSGAVAVVVENDALQAKVEAVRAEVPTLRQVWNIEKGAVDEVVAAGAGETAESVDERRKAVKAADVATIIYTSGTTGRPKGCVLTHANFHSEGGNVVEMLSPVFKGMATEDTSTLLFLPLAHVFGRMVQVGAVQARARLGHTADIKKVTEDLASFKPTFILSVPYVLEKVYNGAQQKAHAAGKGKIFDAAAATAIAYSEANGKAGLGLKLKHAVFDRLVYSKLRAALGGNAKYAISGGAALGLRLTHFFRGVGLVVFEGYGLTETTAALTVNLPDAIKVGSVGRPLPGTAVRVADDGELLFRGGQVFAGYWHNEEATNEAL